MLDKRFGACLNHSRFEMITKSKVNLSCINADKIEKFADKIQEGLGIEGKVSSNK